MIERSVVLRQILEHLVLPTRAPCFRVPPGQTNGLADDQPREWSYEPVSDDFPIPDPVMG